ncbi:MAG: HAMP domain-containing sensor histidine kinase [Pseudomonadota bacterium]
MKISKKLSIIVVLTIIEVSITIGAAFEISKGAKFHQLNVLHLKYNAVFSKALVNIRDGAELDPSELTTVVENIRQQPLDCLALVNGLDAFIMKRIKTHYALGVCESDLRVANGALAAIDEYRVNGINRETLLAQLSIAEKDFHAHSAEFEAPIAKTVTFILRSLIPAIIVISVFNIALITYLSKTISSSIRNAIELLRHSESTHQTNESVTQQISGELGELLLVARERIHSDIMNRELSEQLESEVVKRTKKLLAANADLAEFAYRASHDLKAPLSSTKGLAKFIGQDIDSGNLDEAKENSQKICVQMGKLEKLVVDILSLTRADLGASEKEAIDFHELIRDIKARVFPFGDDADFQIMEDIDIQTPLIAERARIAQILENILSNAIKYRDASKNQQYAKVRLVEEADAYSLTVQDNGIGIPSSRNDDVFKMFKRFHPDIGEGTGLGLSIVKKHVDFLQGKISFSSSTGGTTFAVHIPKQE